MSTVPQHLQGSILDLILKNVDIIQDLTVSSPPYSLASDYFTITFSMKFGKQKTLKTSSHYVFDFSKADVDSLYSYLLDSDFGDFFFLKCFCHVNNESKGCMNSSRLRLAYIQNTTF